jgi:hypothetical protein
MVIATAQLNKEAADFAREDTRFWIVRPRITARRSFWAKYTAQWAIYFC